MTSPVSDDPNIVMEGALTQKSRVLVVVRWKRKYATVRNDERQLVIYDKKVSGASQSTARECQIIELKQICECKAVESSKKRSVFFLRSTADVAGKNQIIFRCSDPDDRDKWITTINDVMNGKIASRCPEFDEVVVSTDALRHLVKSRPKFEGRRMPGKRPRTQLMTSSTDGLNGIVEEADGVESIPSTDQATKDATVPTPKKTEATTKEADAITNEAEATNGVSQPTSPSPDDVESRVTERQNSTNESAGDTSAPDGSTKSEKLSSLQRLKRSKKHGGGNTDGGKAAKADKNPSLFNRIGARISRVFGGSQGSPPTETGQASPGKDNKSKKARSVETPETVAEGDEAREKSADESELNGGDRSETHVGVSEATKSGQAKVIQELAAIAQTAQLVAHKAEALKDAMKDTPVADEEATSESGDKSLVRRDSEKNIQQAAESLRSTLKNLSEAEILETVEGEGTKEGKGEGAKKGKGEGAKEGKGEGAKEGKGEGAKEGKGEETKGGKGEETKDAETCDSEETKETEADVGKVDETEVDDKVEVNKDAVEKTENDGELLRVTDGEETADQKSGDCVETEDDNGCDHKENEDGVKIDVNENCEKDVAITNGDCEEAVISTNETHEKEEGKENKVETKSQEGKLESGDEVAKPVDASVTEEEKVAT